MTTNTTLEEWRDVPGYDGLYKISDQGNLISIRKGKIRQLNPGKTGGGKRYLGTTLIKDGKVKTYLIHQLVAMAFLGYELNGHKIVVDHLNNDGFDNRLENLQLITHSGNLRKNRRPDAISQHIGVTVNAGRSGNKYKAILYINGKALYLGSFKSEVAASWIFKAADENQHLYDGNLKEFRHKCREIAF